MFNPSLRGPGNLMQNALCVIGRSGIGRQTFGLDLGRQIRNTNGCPGLWERSAYL